MRSASGGVRDDAVARLGKSGHAFSNPSSFACTLPFRIAGYREVHQSDFVPERACAGRSYGCVSMYRVMRLRSASNRTGAKVWTEGA